MYTGLPCLYLSHSIFVLVYFQYGVSPSFVYLPPIFILFCTYVLLWTMFQLITQWGISCLLYFSVVFFFKRLLMIHFFMKFMLNSNKGQKMIEMNFVIEYIPRLCPILVPISFPLSPGSAYLSVSWLEIVCLQGRCDVLLHHSAWLRAGC